MFLGLGPGRDRDQNAGTCWATLEVGFKFYFILELILCLLLYVAGGLLMYFPNILDFTIDKLQLWRLLSSFMLPSIGQFAIINVLFQMWILYQFMPDIVSYRSHSKKSTQQPT